jgi:hypothetical protein
MKKYIYLFLINLISFNVFAYRNLPKIDTLSADSYLSLITCDPGNELYSVFGHNAIGVVDTQQNLFLVFNYGTFSFDVPFFYLKFASGKLLYNLSYTTYNNFLYEYRKDKRRVTEERLNLTQYQKQRLFDLLKENYKPENRKYQYDFFFDNCATRIGDMFYKAFGDSLKYTPANNHEVKTFRNLIDEYLINSYWSKFGIDIALGSVIDKPATEQEITFLPDYMSEFANYCTLNGKPFILDSRVLVKESASLSVTPFFIRPQIVFWFVFLIIMVLTFIYHSKSWIVGDKIIFITYGLIGLVVVLLWFATDHDATANNYNILWANPLYLVFASFIGGKHRKILKWSSAFILLINVLVLLFWNIIPQQYNAAFIPFVLILVVRSGVILLRTHKY